ncbi:MAG: alpha-galactosidase [Planctomycetota bacterium]|jgi:alpha-galactosidase
MAKKIVFIGAGSFGFTRALVKDILTFDLIKNSEIALVDINKERLEMARQCCQKLIDAAGTKTKLTVTTDRKKALKGANAVLTTILCGDTKVWQHDILIPKKYGVDINVGDTRGPAGVFRALRTLPEMLGICQDIRKLCPNAILLNYTNPMAMLCQGMQREFPDLAISGLCHSVQGTAKMLARWVGLKYEDIDYKCAGINHLAFYTEFKHKNSDLYPKLKKAVETNKEIYNEEQVRNEMFLALDYYVTESSGHNSEYNWWFRKRSELIKKYCTRGTGWNPGHHAYVLNHYVNRKNTWRKDYKEWLKIPELNDPEKIKEYFSKRPIEYASNIINAWVGGEPFEFNGNVPNTSIITNIQEGACVEVPVLASRNRLQPIHVGDLPIQLTALMGLSAANETMAIEGALTGDAGLIYQSIAHDPLTASVLSLAEIRKMVSEMFKKNKKYLPKFKKVKL